MSKKQKHIIVSVAIVLFCVLILGIFIYKQSQSTTSTVVTTDSNCFDPYATEISADKWPTCIIYGSSEYNQLIDAENEAKERDKATQCMIMQSCGFSESNAEKSTTKWRVCLCIKNMGAKNLEITGVTCSMHDSSKKVKKVNESWDILICPKIIRPGECAYIQMSMWDDYGYSSLDGQTYTIDDIIVYGRMSDITLSGNTFGLVKFQRMTQESEAWTSAVGWIQNKNINEDPMAYVYMVALKNGKIQGVYDAIAHDYSASGHAEFSFHNRTNEDYFINDVDECIFYSFVDDTYSQDADEKNRLSSEMSDNENEIIEQITN